MKKKIINALKKAEKITIISHIRPDGDTLGSSFALKYALEKMGKSASVVCSFPITEKYAFINDGKTDISGEVSGLIVCVDVADPSMAGTYKEYAQKADIVIDHHPTNPCYGKLNLIDASCASCGEIMFEIIKELCVLDEKIATCLYVAISTDTGCFAFKNTTGNTHRVAYELCKTKIDIGEINKILFLQKTKSAFDIKRMALESIKSFENGKIVTMYITNEMMKKSNATEDDIENLSSVPQSIKGTVVAATFKEIENNRYKVSLRTNGEIDGGKVCAVFGGGGHAMAAGCEMKGSLDCVTNQMVDTLKKYL